jgi:hypothetical protein
VSVSEREGRSNLSNESEIGSAVNCRHLVGKHAPGWQLARRLGMCPWLHLTRLPDPHRASARQAAPVITPIAMSQHDRAWPNGTLMKPGLSIPLSASSFVGVALDLYEVVNSDP